jgi:hypothetical protein
LFVKTTFICDYLISINLPKSEMFQSAEIKIKNKETLIFGKIWKYKLLFMTRKRNALLDLNLFQLIHKICLLGKGIWGPKAVLFWAHPKRISGSGGCIHSGWE